LAGIAGGAVAVVAVIVVVIVLRKRKGGSKGLEEAMDDGSAADLTFDKEDEVGGHDYQNPLTMVGGQAETMQWEDDQD
jgi:hypothetical protein